MRWPWQRGHSGEAVAAAKADAQEQLEQAHDGTRRADEVSRTGRELARRSDRFAREVERAFHLRRGSA